MYPGQAAEVQISGERGSAWLKGGFLAAWQFETEDPSDSQTRLDCGPPADTAGNGGASDPRAISFTGHQRQFENFVRCLDGTEDLLVNGKEARKAVEIILAIYKSALQKKIVELPLKKSPKLAAF